MPEETTETIETTDTPKNESDFETKVLEMLKNIEEKVNNHEKILNEPKAKVETEETEETTDTDDNNESDETEEKEESVEDVMKSLEIY